MHETFYLELYSKTLDLNNEIRFKPDSISLQKETFKVRPVLASGKAQIVYKDIQEERTPTTTWDKQAFLEDIASIKLSDFDTTPKIHFEIQDTRTGHMYISVEQDLVYIPKENYLQNVRVYSIDKDVEDMTFVQKDPINKLLPYQNYKTTGILTSIPFLLCIVIAGYKLYKMVKCRDEKFL